MSQEQLKPDLSGFDAFDVLKQGRQARATQPEQTNGGEERPRNDQFDYMLSTLRYVLGAGQAVAGESARDHYNAIIQAIADRASACESDDVRYACEAVKRAAFFQQFASPAASVSDEQINGIVWEYTRLNPNQAADSDLVLCIRKAVRAILALRPAQETPEQKDQSAWCEYVAGMVFGWLQMQRELPSEERCIKAIAGIIERRMWALRPAQAGVPDDIVMDFIAKQEKP